jgi:hypothetical protein
MLATFLALYTLWLYEKRGEPATAELLGWSATAGALAATRADIGGVLVVSFGILLVARYGGRLTGSLLVLAFAAFSIFDPFMWFMPVTHIQGIFKKMFVHYTGTLITGHDYVTSILSFAARGLGAIVLAGLLALRKELPVPGAFIVTLLGATTLVCLVLFTAGFDATRYFMPLIFIWEILLPLFLVSLLVPAPRSRRHQAYRLGQLVAAGAIALIVIAPATVSLYFFARNDTSPSALGLVHPAPRGLITTSP